MQLWRVFEKINNLNNRLSEELKGRPGAVGEC
jgi:hypothetical protein